MATENSRTPLRSDAALDDGCLAPTESEPKQSLVDTLHDRMSVLEGRVSRILRILEKSESTKTVPPVVSVSDAGLSRLEAKIEAKLDGLGSRLDLLMTEKKPGLTIVDFAKASGLSTTTVRRRLADKSLYRVKGRIPYELLRPYLT